MFESTDDAVFVTTFCTPPTSFWSRDWSSPVRVPVKKRSDIACRCSYRRFAQVLHHPLADDGGEVGLEHAQAGRRRAATTIMIADEDVEELQVRPVAVCREERLVEDDLRQEWVDDAERRRGEDEQARTATRPVWREQAEDTRDETADVAVGLVGLVGIRGGRARERRH